jgi:putative ATP-dependent endonuclease of the OLD family
MRIIRIRIRNFRCIRDAEIFPHTHNVLLGPNNVGKTAVLEAVNLVLNPEMMGRTSVIDENDFYQRDYLPPPAVPVPAAEIVAPPVLPTGQDVAQNPPQAEVPPGVAPEPAYPTIRIELVLAGLDQEDEDVFRDWQVPWKAEERKVIESTEEGIDPFADAEVAIRVVFEGWYDPEEDGFDCKTYFLRAEGVHRDECPPLTRIHKRHIGFLIYRDFRALTRPVTLDPMQLFSRLLYSQEVKPRHFEDALAVLRTALNPMTHDDEFMALLNAYKAELERFLVLSESRPSALSFHVTDGTRTSVKSEAQMYLRDALELPIQKSGAGTRSLSILAILTLIMRRRGRGILALEEPETFLFPHAQRRIIDECLSLANQTFITTHSPYVLERVPVEGVGRIQRDATAVVQWIPITADSAKAVNLYAKRLRQVCCEALLGRGVVVVEGDSDKWWLLGASRILNRKVWNGRQQEALELLGVSVVSADANGDAVKLGEFFQKAGLRVAVVLDRVPETDPIWAQAASAPFPCIFLKQAGVEALLAEHLEEGILRQVLASAPHSRVPVLAAPTVAALSEAEVRTNAFDMLRGNKGSASMHEWVMSLLDEDTLPEPLKTLVDLMAPYMSGKTPLGFMSLRA